MPSNGSTESLNRNVFNVFEPTEEFLKGVLKDAAKRGLLRGEGVDDDEARGCETIAVEGVEVEGGGTLGENYGGSMTYANVTVRTPGGVKKLGIVIKTLKETPWHVEIMNIYALFEKEVEFFNKTLPAVIQFQTERGVSRPITELVPRCLYARFERDGGMLITENMCDKGFIMAERRRGLGLTHSILALEMLGRFHAASLTMKLLEPKIFWEAIKNVKCEAYFTEERKIIFDCLYNQLSRGKIRSIARAEAENGAEDADLLLQMAEVAEGIIRNRGQLTMDVLKKYREPLAVLNHGDFWVNNIMFRYETSEFGKKTPVAVKVLDFQMTRYGSPALDIHTFLYTSTTRELRMTHEEDLLRAYHRALLEGIREAGVDPVSDFGLERRTTSGQEKEETVGSCSIDPQDGHPLSFSTLKDELRRHGTWALMIAEMMLRVVMADSSEAADEMEATMMNGTPKVEEAEEKMVGFDMLRQLTTSIYDARLFEVFRELAHKGYLDDRDFEN